MSTSNSPVADPEAKSSRWRQFFRRARDSDPVPVFRIVALGNRASGKTVFLTSFAESLRFTTESRRYSLRVEDRAQRQRLSNFYEELASGEWPRATGSSASDFVTYRFGVNVSNSQDGNKEHLLDIDWIDYPGEVIDNPIAGSSNEDQLFSHVRDASAVFCLLDGEKLRSWIDGEQSGAKYVHRDIQKLVEIAQTASCSTHIVISKWDAFVRPDEHLFPNTSGQLEMLKAALMNVRGFSDLRRRSTIGDTKRFIPVSSVGMGFVTRGPNGDPEISSNPHVEGINLDVPFAAVVLDFLEAAVDQLRPRDKGVLRFAGLRHLPGVADRVLSQTTSSLLRTVSPEQMLAAGTLELVRALIKRPAPSDSSGPPSRELLITDMRQRLVAFEDESPASVLGLPAWARRG